MKEKIKGLIASIDRKIAPYKKNIIIPLLKIIGIIILCAVLVRMISGRETLKEYADKNPEAAYGTEISIEE